MKNKVRGKLSNNKAKNTVKHGAVKGNRGVGERQGTAKIEKEVSHLGHRGKETQNGHADDTRNDTLPTWSGS